MGITLFVFFICIYMSRCTFVLAYIYININIIINGGEVCGRHAV